MAAVDLARFLAGGQLRAVAGGGEDRPQPAAGGVDARGQVALRNELQLDLARLVRGVEVPRVALPRERADHFAHPLAGDQRGQPGVTVAGVVVDDGQPARAMFDERVDQRSEEHTSELQSLMRNSYAVFCLK